MHNHLGSMTAFHKSYVHSLFIFAPSVAILAFVPLSGYAYPIILGLVIVIVAIDWSVSGIRITNQKISVRAHLLAPSQAMPLNLIDEITHRPTIALGPAVGRRSDGHITISGTDGTEISINQIPNESIGSILKSVSDFSNGRHFESISGQTLSGHPMNRYHFL